MKAKLIVEGKEFDIDILDPELQKLLKPQKKTGYERVDVDKIFYYIDCDSCVEDCMESYTSAVDDSYKVANYYSDHTVAENNARADKLMRQLRRFAVEHRESKLDWHSCSEKCFIDYSAAYGISTGCTTDWHTPGAIYFDSEKTCQLAIEAFHDELFWYFTEYKDSL